MMWSHDPQRGVNFIGPSILYTIYCLQNFIILFYAFSIFLAMYFLNQLPECCNLENTAAIDT